ncbi:MAG: hypothetical protein KGK00_08715, partial [Paracoccaceae bacterium]|nr:hypothetical protein [Paracoccaceae bacterium]
MGLKIMFSGHQILRRRCQRLGQDQGSNGNGKQSLHDILLVLKDEDSGYIRPSRHGLTPRNARGLASPSAGDR